MVNDLQSYHNDQVQDETNSNDTDEKALLDDSEEIIYSGESD